MSESILNINTFNCENIDPLLSLPFKITKELFSSSSEFNIEKFVSDVNESIQANSTKKETIAKILDIFSIVRPKQHELLTKIESALSITHSSMENYFFGMVNYKLPCIYELETTQSPIIEIIKNDDFENLQEFVSSKVDFDFTQTFEIEQKYDDPQYVNLLDICAYYGSIQCFKYLVLNKAPFSKYVCPFSICGGNYEIIHYLENNYSEQNFDKQKCLYISIAYHRYAITDWLILNYGLHIINIETAIYSFNYHAFASFIQDHKLSSYELFASARSGNLPVVQYLCEVAKVNTEATFNKDGQTALPEACYYGHLPIVQYLCEVQKVNTETTDKYEWTPLHRACSSGSLPVVQYLCEVANVNTEATNNSRRTPLHIACEQGYLDVVKYLCEVAKVNTEAKDNWQKTPLHFACSNSYLPVVQYLCEVAKVNTEGAYSLYPEVREYLKKYQ